MASTVIGTGFSSLNYLRHFRLDVLKIDRTYAKTLGGATDQVLLEAIGKLGHSLGIEVVAEGVENDAQLDMLRQFGCDQVQGYLISKALPLAELARFLVFGKHQPQLGGS